MPLAATFQPAASSALCAVAGSTRPGSDGFHAAAGFPVVSPCFPAFFTDSTSSPKAYDFRHFLLPRPRTSQPFLAFSSRPARNDDGPDDYGLGDSGPGPRAKFAD